VPTCRSCGEEVSSKYARVCGVDGVVTDCPWCNSQVRDGQPPSGTLYHIRAEGV